MKETGKGGYVARLLAAADAAMARELNVFRWYIFALMLAVILIGGAQSSLKAQEAPASHATEASFRGEVLVKFEPGTAASAISDAHRQNGGQVKETIPGIDVQVVAVDRGQERDRVAAYERNPNVRFAEVNGLYRAADHGRPNDPQVDQQWQYDNTGQTGGTNNADVYAFGAWHATSDSDTVPIAVLDSGIKQSHGDLQGKIAQNANFSTSTTVDDVYGHGTHVAGSAAASTNNGVGVAGTCGGCVLYNTKVLDDYGNGSWSGIANGIVWAADNGAKVINMSLGGTSSSLTVEDAVNYAWGKGAILVAAAGNGGSNTLFYPAAYTNVIAVAATDHNDQKATFSNYGSSWVDVAAPGVSILSTTVDGAYGKKDGTSMATPHVSGVAGLVWSVSPASTTNQSIRDKVEATADPVAGTGTYWAKGRINSCKAVGSTCDRDATPPTVSSVSPVEGATGVSTSTNISATFSEAMDPATLTSSTVTLLEAVTPVAATVSYDGTSHTVTLDPSNLAKRTKYTATVKGGVGGAKDLAGNPLATDKVWSFTTGR